MQYNLPNIYRDFNIVSENVEILPSKKEVIVGYEFINKGVASVMINGLELQNNESYKPDNATICRDESVYKIIFATGAFSKKLHVIKTTLIAVKNYEYK